MRSIDADALREKMYHEAFETDTDMQKWDSGCWIRYKMFENAIEAAPTIEPERKKGKWIRRKKWDKYVCYECSFEHEAVTNYCPNCGADMRGEG